MKFNTFGKMFYYKNEEVGKREYVDYKALVTRGLFIHIKIKMYLYTQLRYVK